MTDHDLISRVLANPFDNVYWLSRLLISTDKSAGIGKNSTVMSEIVVAIQTVLEQLSDHPPDDVLPALAGVVRNTLLKGRRKDSRVFHSLQGLADELEQRLDTVRGYEILAFTCERIMIPINNALSNVPSDDRVFVESFAKDLLDNRGEAGLATIINIWDDLGTEGCLAAERVEVVREFDNLTTHLDMMLPQDSDVEKHIVLSAFCQELERRLAQKRKHRAGTSLEGVTSYILDYFGIPTIDRPEHFTTGLEIDKWVRCRDGWIIGIACKRTFRERWKQAYTTNMNELNRHRIKELWHVITYDRDLSDQKITELGAHRSIIFLPDESPTYLHAANHVGMKDYVRPMSSFISELRAQL